MDTADAAYDGTVGGTNASASIDLSEWFSDWANPRYKYDGGDDAADYPYIEGFTDAVNLHQVQSPYTRYTDLFNDHSAGVCPAILQTSVYAAQNPDCEDDVCAGLTYNEFNLKKPPIPYATTTSNGNGFKLADAANRVSFNGGGQKFKFKMSQNYVNQTLEGGSDPTTSYSTEIEGVAFGRITSKINPEELTEYIYILDDRFRPAGFRQKKTRKEAYWEYEFDGIKPHLSWKATSTSSTHHGQKTSITVVLSDKDEGDYFDVRMHVDKTYGGIIFETTGGNSSCPHEDNTAALLDPQLEIRAPPSTIRPDDAMVFQLHIYNNFGGSSDFYVYPNNAQNGGGLGIKLSGSPFSGNQKFEGIDERGIDTTLAISRGPQQYEYDPIDIKVKGFCKGDPRSPELISKTLYNGDVEQNIVFTRPCPAVDWAGSLAQDRSFIVNTKSSNEEYMWIYIHNPSYAEASLQDLHREMKSSRLESVIVHFKYLGEGLDGIAGWNIASGKANMTTAETMTMLDFTSDQIQEDPYGYASALWELPRNSAGVAQGRYEIKIQSYCTAAGDTRTRFDEHSTLAVPGNVDLMPPQLYGRVHPVESKVLYGEEIRMEFTEPIVCASYYGFNLTIASQEGSAFYTQDDDNVQVICDGRTLSFRFFPEGEPSDAMGGNGSPLSGGTYTDPAKSPKSTKAPSRQPSTRPVATKLPASNEPSVAASRSNEPSSDLTLEPSSSPSFQPSPGPSLSSSNIPSKNPVSNVSTIVLILIFPCVWLVSVSLQLILHVHVLGLTHSTHVLT